VSMSTLVKCQLRHSDAVRCQFSVILSNKHTLRVTCISVKAVPCEAGCLSVLMVYLHRKVPCLHCASV